MVSWVDLRTLHDPAAGKRPPASWGDGVIDNLDFLGETDAAEVLTNETTTSTSYVDLTTVGPSVTLTTDDRALVFIATQAKNSIGGNYAIMSVAVTGATTLAAADGNSVSLQETNYITGATFFPVALNAGSNTFTCKYRVFGGGTANFLRRRLAVVLLR